MVITTLSLTLQTSGYNRLKIINENCNQSYKEELENNINQTNEYFITNDKFLKGNNTDVLINGRYVNPESEELRTQYINLENDFENIKQKNLNCKNDIINKEFLLSLLEKIDSGFNIRSNNTILEDPILAILGKFDSKYEDFVPLFFCNFYFTGYVYFVDFCTLDLKTTILPYL